MPKAVVLKSVSWDEQASGKRSVGAYEHPLPVRICHWLNSISLLVLAASGLRIFRAFPSFGPKVHERVFFNAPRSLTIGGWLGGALQWHITFAWIYVATGLVYLGYSVFSGQYRQILFLPGDLRGVWPMIRHYFFFGRKPPVREPYNPLQKLAYTGVLLLGVFSVLTGLVLYYPVQFSLLATLLGGFHLTRIWHFVALCAFALFLAGHLVMVILHGWNNFFSMLTGWKRDPEYLE